MEAPDFRPCPFCAHDKPIVVTITGDPPVYIVACPECGASGPKQLPGVRAVKVAMAAGCGSRYSPCIMYVCHLIPIVSAQSGNNLVLAYARQRLERRLRCRIG